MSRIGRSIIGFLVGAALLCACQPVLPPTGGGTADSAAQADLRSGLAAENVVFGNWHAYVDTAIPTNIATLKGVDATLDWGGRLRALVGDAVVAADRGVVCLTEASTSGATFSIAQVAAGVNAGTYYGKVMCPGAPTPANVAALGSSW